MRVHLYFVLISFAFGFLPFSNPPWKPTYDLAASTICMAINSSGPYNLNVAQHFGIVSYDWSNQKAQWVNTRPMNCEERMLSQAKATKIVNPSAHVFVYRNLVKALPWFTSVRRILEDPSYSGFFLTFAKKNNGSHVPYCTTQDNETKCSDYYHDQLQTPQVPNKTNPNPDGACNSKCDCGSVPCGEYLFDHRNGSMLTNWLIKEYILSDTAVGSPYIDGLFIDDFWCSNIINGSSACNDPVQGPSEIDKYNQMDMGLTDQDIATITLGWLSNMEAVQRAILKANGYTWSLFPFQDNANAMPLIINNSTTCTYYMQMSCTEKNPFLSAPLLAGLSYNDSLQEFNFLEQQLASFLLMRGPYAYIGFGEWGMQWRTSIPFPDPVWKQDYGYPLDPHCTKVNGPGNSFERRYSKATVHLDCDNWKASIQKMI